MLVRAVNRAHDPTRHKRGQQTAPVPPSRIEESVDTPLIASAGRAVRDGSETSNGTGERENSFTPAEPVPELRPSAQLVPVADARLLTRLSGAKRPDHASQCLRPADPIRRLRTVGEEISSLKKASPQDRLTATRHGPGGSRPPCASAGCPFPFRREVDHDGVVPLEHPLWSIGSGGRRTGSGASALEAGAPAL
jgi:hypothetical protein